MPTLNEQQSRIEQALAATREKIMSRVKDATTLTEHEVIEIGSLLNRIVEVATGDSQDVAESLEMLSGDSETSVTNRINGQALALSDFVGTLGDRLEHQNRESERALEVCSKIGKATGAITSVMEKSQLLSWNISIEASRLGEKGKAVAAIASFMQEFTVSIEETTNTIQAMLDQLDETLPVIRDQATQTATEAQGFAEQLVGEMGELKQSVQKLSGTLGGAAAEAELRNDKVLALSRETLSHLAFQDPMAQNLLRAENDFLDMCGVIGEIAECKMNVVSQRFANYCGNDTDDQAPEAGEVQLF